jgi:hypothetical protein
VRWERLVVLLIRVDDHRKPAPNALLSCGIDAFELRIAIFVNRAD